MVALTIQLPLLKYNKLKNLPNYLSSGRYLNVFIFSQKNIMYIELLNYSYRFYMCCEIIPIVVLFFKLKE